MIQKNYVVTGSWTILTEIAPRGKTYPKFFAVNQADEEAFNPHLHIYKRENMSGNWRG